MIHLRSPAKINLFLDITEKLSNGYHNLITLFQKINIFDDIFIERAKNFELIIKNNYLLSKESHNNLITKAYNLLRDYGYNIPPLKIKLIKNIPTGAGLGGGSSNAGTFIKNVNQIFKLNISSNDLINICKNLGADVYFFTSNLSSAIGYGIGEILKPINISFNGIVLLGLPDFSIKTAEVYKKLNLDNPPKQDIHKLIDGLNKMDFNIISKNLYNELETSAFKINNKLKQYKDMFNHISNNCALMSGSGSTIFAILKNDITIKNIPLKYKKVKFLYEDTTYC